MTLIIYIFISLLMIVVILPWVVIIGFPLILISSGFMFGIFISMRSLLSKLYFVLSAYKNHRKKQHA